MSPVYALPIHHSSILIYIMRPEKVYLVKEAADYLTRSEYVFLTDYQGINAEKLQS